MNPQINNAIQLAVIIITLCLLILPALSKYLSQKKLISFSFEKYSGFISKLLLAVAILSGINYFYLSRSKTSYLHRWDLFHTLIGVKYFEELGYPKLYECAIAIDSKTNKYYGNLGKVRDLSTLKYRNYKVILKNTDCFERFSDERLDEFAKDLSLFNSLTPKRYWKRLFRDKGYNGSPFYSFIVNTIISVVPLTYTTLIIFSQIDIILLLIAFFIVYKTFGFRIAIISFIFFTINFPNRFVHMGGSLLRFDYVAYLIIAMCMLQRKKYKLSGFFVALSSMIRLFPVVFAIAFGIKALIELVQTKKIDKTYFNFFGSYAASLIIFFLLTLTFGRGLDNWTGFMNNMEIHTQKSAGYRIGFQHLFYYSGEITSEDNFVSYSKKAEIFNERKPVYYLFVLLIIGFASIIATKLSRKDATVLLGLLIFFLLFISTRYYYSVFVLMFLFDTDNKYLSVKMGLFIISAITFLIYFFNDFSAFIYNYLFTFMTLLFFIYTITLVGIKQRSKIMKFEN